ncbi:MAG: serine/threonine protein kinase [Verrucomicrobia bacterium]|nr:serine/threonine protein kinase [Verrucomicrobiota bacterium]
MSFVIGRASGEYAIMAEEQQTARVEASSEPVNTPHLPAEISFVGNIRLKRLLSNHSGESDVWLGERPDGPPVAVKIYRYGKLPGIMDERQKCALVHPYLLPILEAGEIEGRYFEVSPYVAGGTLSNLIQLRHQLTETEARTLLKQLSSAIHYLHSQQVLHRDVKPSNVFVTQTEPLELALADFGTARLGSYQTVLTGTIGTVAYSAPEAVTGMQSEASDYWSLGMILLEALTGRPPFAGLDVKQQLYRVASGKVEIPEAIAPRWKQLLTGLLTSDYTVRWRKQEIDGWLKGTDQKAITHGSESVEQFPAPPQVQSIPGTPYRRSLSVRLRRTPETIELSAVDILEIVGDNVRAAILRYFWIILIVGGQSRNEWLALVALGLIVGAQVGFQFLPHRLEELKREVRVNRQLRYLSSSERRSLRRMVRQWMKSVRGRSQ